MNSSTTKIKAGIVGGAGYVGGEIIRLLINHPCVDISFVQSKSQNGKRVDEVHGDLIGECDLIFSDEIKEADVLFLCGGHGGGEEFLQQNLSHPACIIDLSQDFRIQSNAHNFVYGLPELNKRFIRASNRIANPGCFATAIQLALLPLASKQILPLNLYVQATTGSTGAGQNPGSTSHFSWRDNNLSNYKVFDHQHEVEILQSINAWQNFSEGKIHFVPQRGSFTRGILVNCTFNKINSAVNLSELYHSFYANNPFVFVSKGEIHLKQVVNTNKCLIQIVEKKDSILITSIIDNLLKGAAGQAVHNMNIRFGFEEKAGLQLKPIAY